MALALATPQIKVTYCPPRPAHGSHSSEPQFGSGVDRHRPVSVQFNGDDDWSSSGIDFYDFARMHTAEHKRSGERRLPTPAWALDDKLLKEIVVRYYERRAGLRYDRHRSLAVRLHNADLQAKARIPKFMTTMERLGREYVALKTSGENPERRKLLEAEIESLDTCIRMVRRGPAAIVAVVHFYYRMKFDSVATAAELQMKPPAVRQLLYRLNQFADGKKNDTPHQTRRRQRWIAAGMCPRCGKNPPESGRKACRSCLDKGNDLRRNYARSKIHTMKSATPSGNPSQNERQKFPGRLCVVNS